MPTVLQDLLFGCLLLFPWVDVELCADHEFCFSTAHVFSSVHVKKVTIFQWCKNLRMSSYGLLRLICLL